MSRKCRLRSYKSIGDDGKWAADRIEELEAENAKLKAAWGEPVAWRFTPTGCYNPTLRKEGQVMSDKVEQLCMAGAPPEAVLCALMDESNQLRSELQEAKEVILLLREALQESIDISAYSHHIEDALKKTEKWK